MEHILQHPQSVENCAELFQFHTLAQLKMRPAPKWLINGFLTCGGTSLLTAKHRSFKSFFALDMALSVACDVPWQGFEVQAGGVIYIAAEGAAGLTKRAHAWEHHHGVDVGENFVVLDKPLQLHRPELLADFIKTVAGFDPVLIVLDTLARCSVGLEENSSADMGIFADALGELASETRAHILTLHHNNRSGDYRGSSALPAAVDTHLALVRSNKGDSEEVTLITEKQKDFEELPPLLFESRTVPIPNTHGEQTSLIFERAEKSSEGSIDAIEQAVFDGLLSIAPSTGSQSSQWRKACESISNGAFYKAINRLISPAQDGGLGLVSVVSGKHRGRGSNAAFYAPSLQIAPNHSSENTQIHSIGVSGTSSHISPSALPLDGPHDLTSLQSVESPKNGFQKPLSSVTPSLQLAPGSELEQVDSPSHSITPRSTLSLESGASWSKGVGEVKKHKSSARKPQSKRTTEIIQGAA